MRTETALAGAVPTRERHTTPSQVRIDSESAERPHSSYPARKDGWDGGGAGRELGRRMSRYDMGTAHTVTNQINHCDGNGCEK